MIEMLFIFIYIYIMNSPLTHSDYKPVRLYKLFQWNTTGEILFSCIVLVNIYQSCNEWILDLKYILILMKKKWSILYIFELLKMFIESVHPVHKTSLND